eukprot:3328369-Rhodomonas_salina.1
MMQQLHHPSRILLHGTQNHHSQVSLGYHHTRRDHSARTTTRIVRILLSGHKFGQTWDGFYIGGIAGYYNLSRETL